MIKNESINSEIFFINASSISKRGVNALKNYVIK